MGEAAHEPASKPISVSPCLRALRVNRPEATHAIPYFLLINDTTKLTRPIIINATMYFIRSDMSNSFHFIYGKDCEYRDRESIPTPSIQPLSKNHA